MSSILHSMEDSTDASSVIEGLDIVGIQESEATIAVEPGSENNGFGFVETTVPMGNFDSGVEGVSGDVVGELGSTAEANASHPSPVEESVEFEIFSTENAPIPGGIVENSEIGVEDLTADDFDIAGGVAPDFEIF